MNQRMEHHRATEITERTRLKRNNLIEQLKIEHTKQITWNQTPINHTYLT